MTVGSNPAELRQLAARFRSEATTLEAEVRGLVADADHASWVGKDATAFRSRLDNMHVRAASQVVGRLRRAADELVARAWRQEQVSAD